MNYSIETLPSFDKKLKKLAKKYKSLKNDLQELVNELMQNPSKGVDLGNGVHKFAWQSVTRVREKVMVPGL